jgi:hypothetical protein
MCAFGICSPRLADEVKRVAEAIEAFLDDADEKGFYALLFRLRASSCRAAT